MEVIESVARVRGKVYVVCQGETIVLTRQLYQERPLQPGDTLDWEEYEQWLLLHQYRPALNEAVAMLAQRPCASGEIRQKLERRGYRPQTVEMVLYKLSSNDLLDDAAFARQWASTRTNRGLGASRIAGELRRKGIAKEEAEAALASLDADAQLESAVRLAQKGLARAKAGEDARRTAQRVLAMLARRGYTYDQAREAIRLAREMQS